MDQFNVITFKDRVLDFLKHPEKSVVSIKGEWGVGKTHTWNKIIKNNFDTLNYEGYSYVSLFGLENIKEVQSSVFYNSVSNFKDDKKSLTKNIKALGKIAKALPIGAKYSSAMSLIESSLIKNHLICIDDIERKSNNLEMADLLGYISNASEKTKSKFILIFNNNTLSEKDLESLSRYREKVIDLELEFNPTPDSNISLQFDSPKIQSLLSEIFSSEKLNNIRILRHIKWITKSLENYYSRLEEEVKSEVFTSISVLTYIHHEPSLEIKAKEVEELLSYRSKRSDKEKEVVNRIFSMGFTSFLPYEEHIVNYIENGYLDEISFSSSLNELNERHLKNNIQSKLTHVWGLYNNNFQASTGQFTTEMKVFLKEHQESLHYSEILPIIETLQDLDSEFSIDVAYKEYITARFDGISEHEIRDIREKVTDQDVLDLIKEKELLFSDNRTAYEIMNKIALNRCWNPSDIVFLSEHSEDEICDLLLKEKDKDVLIVLRELIRIFPETTENDTSNIFGTNLAKALRRLAEENTLNSYRVEKFLCMPIKKT